MQVDVELLATLESVTLGETNLHLWSVASDGASVERGLEVEVVGLVEGTVETKVKRVFVARCKLEVYGREDARSVDLGGCFLILLVAEQLTGPQAHVLQQHTWTYRRILLVATPEDVEAAPAQAVGNRLAHGASQLQVGVADVPLLHGLLGQSVGQLYAQLCAVWHVQRVGKVCGVAGVEVVIAVVAQQGADTGAFSLQGTYAEGLVLMDNGLGSGGVDEPAGNLGKADIGNAVEGEQGVEVYVIGYLALFRVLQRDRLIGDAGVEVAVVAEYAGRGSPDSSTQVACRMTWSSSGRTSSFFHHIYYIPTGARRRAHGSSCCRRVRRWVRWPAQLPPRTWSR